MLASDAAEIERIIGYVFNDKRLLSAAFTHSSLLNENRRCGSSYERLEFLGDSILDFIVAEELFLGSGKGEGDMSKLRAGRVSRDPLAGIVDRLGLMKYLQVGNGAKNDVFRSRKVRSDLFEAIIAAIYLDSGRQLDSVRKFILKNLFDVEALSDYKSALQVHTQKEGKLPVYSERGVGANGEFLFDVSVDGELMGTGRGTSKHAAQQSAAKNALRRLGILP